MVVDVHKCTMSVNELSDVIREIDFVIMSIDLF